MPNKIIKQRSDLPDWFLADDYCPSISDPVSWAMEIDDRLALDEICSHNSSDRSRKEALVRFEAFVTIRRPRTKLVPASDQEATDINIFNSNHPLGALGIRPLQVRASVSSLNARDVVTCAAAIPATLLEYIPKIRTALEHLQSRDHTAEPNHESVEHTMERWLLAEELGRDDKLQVSASSCIDELQDHHVRAAANTLASGRFCVVDVHQDDETLQDHFAKWVAQQREIAGVEVQQRKSPLTSEIMLEWNDFKPLQVFDIDLWARLADKRISDALIASTLWSADQYSGNIDYVDRLRKTTRKKKIPSIISDHMLARLKGLITIYVNGRDH